MNNLVFTDTANIAPFELQITVFDWKVTDEEILLILIWLIFIRTDSIV
jgi:hypothetical protein